MSIFHAQSDITNMVETKRSLKGQLPQQMANASVSSNSPQAEAAEPGTFTWRGHGPSNPCCSLQG